jgi:hypothetical protein
MANPSEPKFTKGPWRISSLQKWYVIPGDGAEPICSLAEALQAALPHIEALTYSGHRPPSVAEAKRVKALIEAALKKAGL